MGHWSGTDSKQKHCNVFIWLSTLLNLDKS
jgi:hypothetical protein